MKRNARAIVGLLMLAFCSLRVSVAEDKCLTCHETVGGKAVELFMHDVHHAKGISCAGCHGGNARIGRYGPGDG